MSSSDYRDYARFRVTESFIAWSYPKPVLGGYGRSWLDDRDFKGEYRRFSPDSWQAADRKYMLKNLVKLIDGVNGDTAECGVYNGGSSYLICQAIRGSGRTHHGFDSFKGLSAPSSEDGRFWKTGDLSVPLAVVERDLAEFPYVILHAGWIPEVLQEVGDRRFAFVHIDVDLYAPTRDSLAFFYPRMEPGGLIVCDDYGFATCPGATRAWDEFMAGKPEPTIACPTGQAFLIKR